LEAQGLLVPETVSLTPVQAALVLEQREALAQLGLQVQDFGSGTLLLASYPALLGKRSPSGILRAVADHLAANGRAPQREQLLHALGALGACRGGGGGGDGRRREEIDPRGPQPPRAGDSHHCPPGGPPSLLFPRRDLDRQFRRI